jgi:hypothetical protein
VQGAGQTSAVGLLDQTDVVVDGAGLAADVVVLVEYVLDGVGMAGIQVGMAWLLLQAAGGHHCFQEPLFFD